MSYFNRYNKLISNGLTKQMPFIKLTVKATDKSVTWSKLTSRMDVLSQRYYGHPYGGFLILLANPQYGDEFDIPDGTTIRIPFPYETTKQQFNDELNRYNNKFGF